MALAPWCANERWEFGVTNGKRWARGVRARVSSGGCFRFQPISFSGARIVMSTEAGGPAAITRSIRSGTSTWRPDESAASLPAVAGKDESMATRRHTAGAKSLSDG
jgi:hypothetical protein